MRSLVFSLFVGYGAVVAPSATEALTYHQQYLHLNCSDVSDVTTCNTRPRTAFDFTGCTVGNHEHYSYNGAGA